MADVKFEDFDDGAATRHGSAGQAPRLIAMAGAVTSVALMLGMGYWGYRLAVRDMTGIPVVRALEGPMRIAPEDPGGVIADNQGLSVNDIAADGGISAPADRLILAPAPVGLIEGDATGTAIAMVAPVSGRAANMPGLAIAPMPEGEAEAQEPVQTVSLNGKTDITALVESLTEGAVPLSGEIDITLNSAPEASYSLPKGALAMSPRPRARPAGTVTMAAAAAATTEITGENLASGTRLVQLGAFDSEDIARKEWERLAGKFSDLLIDKTRIVQSAKSGGRTFYRLRAMGFQDEADSRRFCSALVAESAACIPVAVR
ncbi:MAG: SPOR domain-containing protein [Pseudorhodobacter sp.]